MKYKYVDFDWSDSNNCFVFTGSIDGDDRHYFETQDGDFLMSMIRAGKVDDDFNFIIS